MKKFLFILFIGSINTFSQISPDYKGGFKIKFDDEGKKYLRFITFLQSQAVYNNEAKDNVSKTKFQIRRARLLAFSQINEDFLVFLHLGLNSLDQNNLSPLGKGGASQFFLHDAYLQYKLLDDKIYAGFGLHCFNGISRLNNQSTTNMVTLSNNRSSWATVGLTDQFARHLGVFVKGHLSKLNYRISVNDASVNSLDSEELTENTIRYQGAKTIGTRKAGKVFAGYFDYNFFDQEKGLLAYKVGNYLGTKKVFNIGAGFFSHPNGTVSMDSNGSTKNHDVNIISVDAFYDAPFKGGAISAYAQYQINDYGKNYNFGPYATGNMAYGHLGYLIPSKNKKVRVQPFVAQCYRTADAIENESHNTTKVGANLFLSGHNSKLTLQYQKEDKFGTDLNTVVLQAQILF